MLTNSFFLLDGFHNLFKLSVEKERNKIYNLGEEKIHIYVYLFSC